MKLLRVSLASAIVGLLLPCVATGQVPGRRPAKACLDSIPLSELTRVVVYMTASVSDSIRGVSPQLLAGADQMAQSVSEAVRRLLGARGDIVPAGEPALTWKDINDGVAVVARRDGTFGWRFDTASDPDTTMLYGRAAVLLGRALDSVRASGDGLLWDPTVQRDSLMFGLRFVPPSVGRDGLVTPPTLQRAAIPTMTLAVPWEEPVANARMPLPQYPPRLREMNYQGAVLMQFVVDEEGAVLEKTVRDVRPRWAPAFVGSDGDAYGLFVQAVRRALQSARYDPARVGGCPVRQQVEQPFTFALTGGPTNLRQP